MPARSSLSSSMLIFALMFALALLAGCDKQVVIGPGDGGYRSPSQTTQPDGAGGTPGARPYTVMGKTYYPLVSADNFSEEGIASWYGKDFHGKRTASGERYDMYGMTAAHKLLPFGTLVRVTSKVNGESIEVRVNDRGPFVDNRVIDLTYTGAQRLGMLASGTAPVIIQTMGQVEGLSGGRLAGNFYVQVGAFSVESNAAGLVQALQGRGYSARSVFVPSINFWRVQIGPYGDLSRAETVSEQLLGEFEHNFIVAD